MPEIETPVAEASASESESESVVVKPEPSEGAISTAALKERLAQKERSLLKEMGFADLAAAKAAASELAKLKADRMTDEEKSKVRIAELEMAAKERDELKADQQSLADAELAKLSEAQREFILEAAPRSPAKQLKLIAKLGAVAPAQTAPAIKQAPANTAPAAKAPPATSVNELSVVQRYEQLQSVDPARASAFRLANLSRYLEEKKARA